jgi:hypothetical protein
VQHSQPNIYGKWRLNCDNSGGDVIKKVAITLLKLLANLALDFNMCGTLAEKYMGYIFDIH